MARAVQDYPGMNAANKHLLVPVAIVIILGLSSLTTVAVRYRGRLKDTRQELQATEEEVRELRSELVMAKANRRGPASVPLFSVPEPPQRAASSGAAATNDLLRLEQQVRALEDELREKEQHIASLQQATNRPPREARRPRDRGAWMEELKEGDPERYEEIVTRREEMRNRVKDAFARKSAHFLERDTSTMGEDEQEAHVAMVQLLEETWQIAEQLQADPPRDERWALRREMGEKMSLLGPMLEEERDREFYRLGIESGYDDDEATAFVDYLNEVLDITSMRSLFRGMGGRGGPRGPRDRDRAAPQPQAETP